MMKLTNQVEHYRQDAERYDYFAELHPLDADSARRIQQAVLHMAAIPGGALVADIGSGNGWLIDALKHKSCTVVSVDLGLRNLRCIRELFGSEAAPVSADATALPFKTGSVDCVVASEILEHLNEPEAAVQEAFRVLKPGGYFIASTPYKEKLRTYLCVHCNKPTPANAHIQTFDEQRHRKQVENNGFLHYSYTMIQNKYFTMSRLSYLSRWMPFSMWRMFDRMCNLFFRRAQTIVFKARKPSETGARLPQ